jgi:hypothetical protein
MINFGFIAYKKNQDMRTKIEIERKMKAFFSHYCLWGNFQRFYLYTLENLIFDPFSLTLLCFGPKLHFIHISIL